MKYVGQDQQSVNTWECLDSFSYANSSTIREQDEEFRHQKNCMANAMKSVTSFEGTDGQPGNKAYVMSHFMREFNATNIWPDQQDSDDNILNISAENMYIDLIFAATGMDTHTKLNHTLDWVNPLDGQQDVLSCPNGAQQEPETAEKNETSGAKNISVYQVILASSLAFLVSLIG